MMKKYLSILLAALIMMSVISCAFIGANAAEALPLDGSVIGGETDKEVPFTEYALSVQKTGIVHITFTADDVTIITLKQGYKMNVVLNHDSDSFKNTQSVTREFDLYLKAGEYVLEIYGFNLHYSISAAFEAFNESESGTVLSANKKLTYFRAEGTQTITHKLIVKNNYRLEFTIDHTAPTAVEIKNSAGNAVFKNTNYVSGSLKQPATEKFTVNLLKGTYQLDVSNVWSKGETVSTGCIYHLYMGLKRYVPVPAGLKTVTRKGDRLTISYAAASAVSGYQVQCSIGGTQWAQTKTGTSKTCAFYGLKAGVVYKFRVRAYLVEDGKKVFGNWSKTFSAATTPGTPKIFSITSKTPGLINVIWKKAGTCSGYQLYYSKSATFKKVEKKLAVRVGPYANQVLTMGKFDSGKTYYVKVRAFTQVGSSYVFGAWSKPGKIKVK